MFKALLNVLTGKEKIHTVEDDLSTLKYKVKSNFNIYNVEGEFEATPGRYAAIKNKLFDENYDMVLYFCSEMNTNFDKQNQMAYLENILLEDCKELDNELYFIKPTTEQCGFQKYDTTLYGTMVNINDQLLPIIHIKSIKDDLLIKITIFVKFINDREYAKTGEVHFRNIVDNFAIIKNE